MRTLGGRCGIRGTTRITIYPFRDTRGFHNPSKRDAFWSAQDEIGRELAATHFLYGGREGFLTNKPIKHFIGWGENAITAVQSAENLRSETFRTDSADSLKSGEGMRRRVLFVCAKLRMRRRI